ncbi:HTH-type sugar sensing transcriptional regulator TrmB [Halorientalis sp.]|uniref:HTH-type sugar sensing transcriptional regulator TrmB n=1 Tax=Halorientalis sp. TaxID=1931229 RepID=UPI0026180FEC|nr:TrmB family transcriptional regulator [Halorientalis sp.]
MSEEDLHATLERVAARFDFGEYESAAYLTILEHGQLTASEIADRTDIPQPRVYDTVRDLADLGLVELQESRPMRVLAVDPEEAFADFQTSLDDLVDGLSRRYTAPARDTEAVSLIKSRSTILRYLEEIIGAAEYELILSLDPELLDRFADDLRAQHEAGVAIELLLSPAADVPDKSEFDYLDVATTVRARRGITTPVVAVADGDYSVYATQDALQGDRDRYGVIFNRSELGFLVSGFLNTVLWTTAETVAEGTDDRPFPRRYATIRRCISDLRHAEGDFYAAIEGRDVLTGERREVQGSVDQAAFGAGRQTATLMLETDDGPVEVGGQVAAVEDVEAHEIRIGEDSPPSV